MKSGKNRGLPDDGIRVFWPGYSELTRPEKENRVRKEYQKILEFGSRWDEVLKKLNIQPVTTAVKPKWFGKGGESDDHKALKQYVRNHPEIVGATAGWETIEEYTLPSLDQIDVFSKPLPPASRSRSNRKSLTSSRPITNAAYIRPSNIRALCFFDVCSGYQP